MAATPGPSEAAHEGKHGKAPAAKPADNRAEATVSEKAVDDRPELLIELQARKERYAQRGIVVRVLVLIGGALLVLAGIVLSGPGIPGPGFLLILFGLSFLALEFDWAEGLLTKAIVWGDNAKKRAENASPLQKALTAALTLLALGAFVAAAILYDIPLLPF